MIIQESGRELAAAMLLFGQELRGDQIVDAGLAFQYVPNADDLVSEAVTFAEGAARVPRALATRLKHTLDGHRAIESHPAAVEFELEAQAWSREQDFFTEQISEAIGRQKKGGDRGS
jgi:enoyl-CoA hydratase/carnithine racemase